MNDKEKIEKILWLIDASEPVITSTKQKCVLCKEIRGVERITKDMTDDERDAYLKSRYDN